MTAIVDGVSVAVGNGKLMDSLGIKYVECSQVGTIVHVALDGQYAGHILIADVLKPTSAEAVRQLKKSGIRETVMLTGDMERVARQAASEIGVDKVYSELLPADKVAKVEEMIDRKGAKEKLAFVGNRD